MHIARLRLIALVWFFGMLGIGALLTLHLPKLLPELLQGKTLPISITTLLVISGVQSALLMALAAWIGAITAPTVGLRAPALEAAAKHEPVLPHLMPQLRVGLGFGALVGFFLFAVNALGPENWVAVQSKYYPSLLPRVLYGGITEEVLLRWGFMSAVTWALWRAFNRQGEPATTAYLWFGIIVSSLLFGALHLPAVNAAVGGLDSYLVFYIVGANAAAAGIFGWLYWKHGLEAAIFAHGFAHVINFLLGLV